RVKEQDNGSLGGNGLEGQLEQPAGDGLRGVEGVEVVADPQQRLEVAGGACLGRQGRLEGLGPQIAGFGGDDVRGATRRETRTVEKDGVRPSRGLLLPGLEE